MMRAFVIATLTLACVFFLIFGAMSHFPRLVEAELFTTKAQWLTISAYRGRVWLLHNQDVSSLPLPPLVVPPVPPPMPVPAPTPKQPTAHMPPLILPTLLKGYTSQIPFRTTPPQTAPATFDWRIIKFSSSRQWPLQVTLLRFPFWLPSGLLLAILFLMAGVPWLRRRYRRRRGQCLRCAYDLRFNESGICPECGSKFDATVSRIDVRPLPFGSVNESPPGA
jgi:hypothetical protein